MTAPERLLRIQEVAEEVGVTPRAIRHYEDLGLLAPAARSDGAYRLYDADDLERLRFIRALRDDAGFSLAEVGQMLEDEAARSHRRERLKASIDPAEREALLRDAVDRIERQIAILRTKAERIGAMVAEAEERRERILAKLGDPGGSER
jgi:MerR family copper efflux transcriptional regulator